MADAPTPRWVKVVGIVVAVLALLLVVALVFGGEHGPGRHRSSGSPTGGALSAVAADAQRPPLDGGRG